MAINKRVDQFDPAPPLSGGDIFPIVPFGTTTAKRSTLQDIANFVSTPGNKVFTDAVARVSSIPDFIGQIGIQLDTDAIYRANGVLAGNWTFITAVIGSTSITTLGTITTGTWQGIPIGATFGGTGQTIYAIGDILAADTTTTLSKIPDIAIGNALISGGVGTLPLWGKIGLTTHVSGILPFANGGTGLSTLGLANDLLRVNAGATALEYFTPTYITPTTGYINGGNAFGGNATLGLTDNFNLSILTNNTARVNILGSGYTGINITNPLAQFDILNNIDNTASLRVTNIAGGSGQGIFMVGKNSSGDFEVNFGANIGVRNTANNAAIYIDRNILRGSLTGSIFSYNAGGVWWGTGLDIFAANSFDNYVDQNSARSFAWGYTNTGDAGTGTAWMNLSTSGLSIGKGATLASAKLNVGYSGVTVGDNILKVEGSFFGPLTANTYGSVGIGFDVNTLGGFPLYIGATGNSAVSITQGGFDLFKLQANGSNDAFMFMYGSNGGTITHAFQANGARSLINNGTGLLIGVSSSTDIDAMFGVKGLGSTLTTYGLKILDASNNINFYVRDDGAVNSRLGYWIADNRVLWSNGLTTTSNLFCGYLSGNTNITSGTNNSAFGKGTLSAITEGSQNAAFGTRVLFTLSTGTNNIGIGDYVLPTVSTGSSNIAIGFAAGQSLDNPSKSISLGGNTSPSPVLSLREILCIGYGTNAQNSEDYEAIIGASGYILKNFYFGTGRWAGNTDMFDTKLQGTSAIPSTNTIGLTPASNHTTTNFIIASGQSTGNVASGSILLQTSSAGGAGSTANALITRIEIKGNGAIAPVLQVGNAGRSAGELYKDTAANILTNADYVVGMKA